MSIAVCNGALCVCSFGVAPCVLVATTAVKCIANNVVMATIMDYKQANLATFGMCNSMANPAVSAATAAALGVLTPQPCSPLIQSPWIPGSPTVMLENNLALTNTSKAMCAYGGIVQIVNPGAPTVQIP